MNRLPAPASPLRTDLLLQAGLFLLVASIPFEYPKRTIPVEIPTLTGALFLLITLLYPRRCYGQLPGPVLWFGLYLLAFLLSVVMGQGEHTSEALAEFVVILQGTLVLLAAINLLQDESVATRVTVTLVAACGIRASLPFLGWGRTTDPVWTGGERVSALGQNANSAAMILAAGLIALIGLTLLRRRRSAAGLVLAGALAVVLGLAILETGSRGGFVALLSGVLLFALAASSWRHRLRNGMVATLAGSLLIMTALRLPVMKNRLVDSALTGNMAGREQLYPALWTMFLEKPVLGWGPITNTQELALRIGERERPTRASHNLVLELLTATGLVGTIPFLIGAWLSVRGAWRARRGVHGVLPLALLCTLFVANMSGDWIASKLLWLALAYAFVSGRWRSPVSGPEERVEPRRWAMPVAAGAGGR
jgi:O-antigen ligase